MNFDRMTELMSLIMTWLSESRFDYAAMLVLMLMLMLCVLLLIIFDHENEHRDEGHDNDHHNNAVYFPTSRRCQIKSIRTRFTRAIAKAYMQSKKHGNIASR